MTTRIPSIRWPGAVKYGASMQRRSCSKKADRILVGQCRVLTPSISVAVTTPLHFQSDVQQRRYFAYPPVSNIHTRIAFDNLTVRSFSSTDGDAATSKRDDTNQVCRRHALMMAASIHFSYHLSSHHCKIPLHSKSFHTPNLEKLQQHKMS